MRETHRPIIFAALIGLAFSTTAFGADRMKPEDVIGKHLDSVGKAETRATVTSRIVNGRVVFGEIIARNIQIEGTNSLLSQGRKLKCTMQFGDPHYPGEQLVFDGQKTMVATVDPTNRSSLGTFLYQQEEILGDGLFGGVLSTAWLLLNQKEVGGKLKYEGLKKIDGRDLHDLTYISKKHSGSGDFIIHLYFDQDTFRHVRTVYTLTQHIAGGSINQGTDETRRTLEERFSDFVEAEGITLPRHWEIRYRTEPQTQPMEFRWDITIAQVQNNPI